jgi:hypothetical protein
MSTILARSSKTVEGSHLPAGSNTGNSDVLAPGSASHEEAYVDLALSPSRHDLSLPPMDGGKDAWLFLAAGFMFEALVWGKHLSVVGRSIQRADKTLLRLPLCLWYFSSLCKRSLLNPMCLSWLVQ